MPGLAYQLAAASGLLLGVSLAAHGQVPAQAGRAAGQPLKISERRPPASKAPAGLDRFRYVPTAALRQQTVLAVARQLQASNPTQAQVVRRSFGPGQADYDQLYTALLRESGLADNDAASALALYLEAGYRIVNDVFDNEVVTPDMERALRRQAAGLLAQRPDLGLPAAVAQLGEQLKLRSVLLTLDWQQARAGSSLATFREAVARQLQAEYGLDMPALQITTQGLVGK